MTCILTAAIITEHHFRTAVLLVACQLSINR
jgi:hypothetical protein